MKYLSYIFFAMFLYSAYIGSLASMGIFMLTVLAIIPYADRKLPKHTAEAIKQATSCESTTCCHKCSKAKTEA